MFLFGMRLLEPFAGRNAATFIGVSMQVRLCESNLLATAWQAWIGAQCQ
jgi:hypothetical protein